MLGLAVSNATVLNANGAANDGTKKKQFFLYYTEPNPSGEVRNRIYRYEWDSGGSSKFDQGKMILDLPGTPGSNHDGGTLAIGPDGTLYRVIGELNRDSMVQNFENGPPPDGTSAIFRIDQNGNAANNNPLSDDDPAINAVLSK
jgi:aldose sugar dehydrogenase